MSEDLAPPPGWELFSAKGPEPTLSGTGGTDPHPSLRELLAHARENIEAYDRNLRAQQLQHARYMRDLLDGVDIDRLPPRAQHLVWLLDSGGALPEAAANWLEGELNEVRRSR